MCPTRFAAWVCLLGASLLFTPACSKAQVQLDAYGGLTQADYYGPKESLQQASNPYRESHFIWTDDAGGAFAGVALTIGTSVPVLRFVVFSEWQERRFHYRWSESVFAGYEAQNIEVRYSLLSLGVGPAIAPVPRWQVQVQPYVVIGFPRNVRMDGTGSSMEPGQGTESYAITEGNASDHFGSICSSVGVRLQKTFGLRGAPFWSIGIGGSWMLQPISAASDFKVRDGVLFVGIPIWRSKGFRPVQAAQGG